MTISEFWQLIENIWNANPERKTLRDKIITESIPSENDETWQPLIDYYIDGDYESVYRDLLMQLNEQELTSYIYHLEERMYHIDRQEIHEYLDGSDDGFLYSRCFVLSMGESYYALIDNNPEKGEMDLEFEMFGFIPYDVYEEKFGKEFDRYQFHSMESGSNELRWD